MLGTAGVWGTEGHHYKPIKPCITKMRAVLGKKSNSFLVHVELHQGNTLSPFLFVILMDRISRHSQGVWYGSLKIAPVCNG